MTLGISEWRKHETILHAWSTGKRKRIEQFTHENYQFNYRKYRKEMQKGFLSAVQDSIFPGTKEL
jgi:hypothetical protein